ncbi:MAG: hypothetical protein C0502_08290 [Opitutus sp.]|nr:hypothetical protein [Opitutus sp.]
MLSVTSLLLRGVLCATLLIASGCGKKAAVGTAGPSAPRDKQSVEVTEIVRRDLTERISLVGSLAPNETAQIRAEVSGQVREVLFAEGEKVARGTVLVRVDDSELRAQVAQSEARFRLAELNLKRSEGLTQAKSMSQAEADRTKSEYSSAAAELQLLRVRLAKTEIRAPFDGIVGARTISPGDYITAATVITVLDDLSRLKVDFQVPERFAERVRQGSEFSLRAQTPSGEARAKGEVYFVSSVIDRLTRSTQVKGFLAADTLALKPGMFANIDLILQVRRGVLTVPEGAILTTPKGTQIIAVRDKGADKVAEMVPVTLGLRERGLVEIVPLRPETLDEKVPVVASGVGGLMIFPGSVLEPRPLRQEFRIGE